MRRRILLFLDRHLIIGIFLLLLLILVLPLIVFLFQQQIKGREQMLRVTSSPYPANIDFEPISSYGTYHPAALSNPNIGAVDINMNWVNVEPRQGVFNWGPADNEAAAWAGQGKKFTLIIRYIKEGPPGKNCGSPQFLPAWEIGRIQNFCDRDIGILIPDYFDSTFKADLKAYVQAIAQHFIQGPYKKNLLYVRIGVGIGGEGFPLMPGGDYPTDKNELIAYGYTPQNWAAWQKEMMSYYKSVFPYTTVIYPLNGQDTDPTTGQPVQVENAYWAAAHGLGVGQQGLQPGTNSPLFQSLRSQYPKLYIQYQTIAAVDSYASVQADIYAADRNGAQFIEWYSRNVVNPAYQSLYGHWQQLVTSKFGNVSSSSQMLDLKFPLSFTL